MSTKHTPPRSCELRRALLGGRPSAILSRCLLGLRSTRKACKGCTANVAEAWQEGFAEGLKRRGSFGTLLELVTDPHEPLERRPWETEAEFVERVNGKIADGKLTMNAARKSFGLPPIEHTDKEGET